MAGSGDEHLLPRGKHVGDDRLPSAVSVCRIEKDLRRLRTEQSPQAILAIRDDRIDARIGKIHRLVGHRIANGLGHVCRAGRVQETVSREIGIRA